MTGYGQFCPIVKAAQVQPSAGRPQLRELIAAARASASCGAACR
jgi:hypothetical protein